MKPSNITKNDWELLKKLYPNKLEKIKEMINKGFPVQYIIGYVDFFNVQVLVKKGVLIPRFETETLVEKTLKYIEKYIMNPTIIDLGTGTGCIAIALKKTLPEAIVTGIDISSRAIKLAKKNALYNNVNVYLKKDNIKTIDLTKYNVIISNPPYIGTNDYLAENVKKYEPKLALKTKNNGLYYYEQIIKKISNKKKGKLLVAFEINFWQGDIIEYFVNFYNLKAKVHIEKDLANRSRFVFIVCE